MRPFKLPVGGVEATVFALGHLDTKNSEVPSRDLAKLQSQDSVQEHHPLAQILSEELYRVGVKKAFVPQVASSSTNIVSAKDLQEEIRLGEIVLYRNEELPADGLFLKPRQTLVANGGKAIILANAGRNLIAAIAGRDSLIDPGAVRGNPTRAHLSVVDAIIAAFKGQTDDITMVMLFAPPASMFEHRFADLHEGEYNQALNEFVQAKWNSRCVITHKTGMFLNIESVFVEQATKAGVRKVMVIHSLIEYPRLVPDYPNNSWAQETLFMVKRET